MRGRVTDIGVFCFAILASVNKKLGTLIVFPMFKFLSPFFVFGSFFEIFLRGVLKTHVLNTFHPKTSKIPLNYEEIDLKNEPASCLNLPSPYKSPSL